MRDKIPGPGDTVPDVGILGVGPMGLPIARRVLAAGFPLSVWNRTHSVAAQLASDGARVAVTPADAAEAVVLTVLPDLPQVEAVMGGPDGLLAGWARRGIARPILVIHGTTSPVATAAFTERLRDRGVAVIDAPLSGGTVGAASGTLSVMAGGDRTAFDAVAIVFGAYGRVVTYFGPAGSGAMAKACNQIVVASTVVAVSEALALGESAGLDRADLIAVLEGGLAGSEVLRQKKHKWLSGDYREGGSAKNQVKDLRFIEEAAAEQGLTLGAAAVAQRLFTRMVERGDGELDHTGVIRVVTAREHVDI
jgi:3-hydroxyisobutyrate dehydrogenase-like beta-hydroxyacid dehydrogenase